MDTRLEQLKNWLTVELGLTLESITSASADASFRRYFRAHTNQGVMVIMDAPPENEPVENFISIDLALAKQGVHTPRIHQKNITEGFLLLEDLGDRPFLDELLEARNTPSAIEALYGTAIDSLIKLQKGSFEQPHFQLTHYDASTLDREMNLFEDWYAIKHWGAPFTEQHRAIWADTKQLLITACLEQPQVWVHRDFHSRNLMVTDTDSPGVIDFQDMVIGPIGYDLASIFKDCYIEWPRQQQHQWLNDYRQYANQALDLDIDQKTLIRWVDLCGLQRHLKVLGIFCRLNYRDHKAQYLADLPLVAKYVLEVLPLYPQLSEFESAFGNLIKRAL